MYNDEDRDVRENGLKNIIGALLRYSGVQYDGDRLARRGTLTTVSLPVRATSPADAESATIASLLPVLAWQITGRFIRRRGNDRVPVPLCTRCGKPATIEPGKRAPRQGQPWYGDHDECRIAARKETRHRNFKRYYQPRWTSAIDSQSDSQDDGRQ